MILKNTHIQVFQKTKIQQKYMFERRFFKVLVSLGILSIFLYVFSLSSVIYGVVQRRTLEKEVAQEKSTARQPKEEPGMFEQVMKSRAGRTFTTTLAREGAKFVLGMFGLKMRR